MAHTVAKEQQWLQSQIKVLQTDRQHGSEEAEWAKSGWLDKQLSSHTDSDSSAGVAVILTPVNQPALAFRGQTSNAVCWCMSV